MTVHPLPAAVNPIVRQEDASAKRVMAFVMKTANVTLQNAPIVQ